MPKNKDDLVRWGDVEDAVRQFHREQTVSKYDTKADCDLARRMVLWTLYQLEHVPTVTAEKGKTMDKVKPCPVCGGMGCSRCDDAGVVKVPVTVKDWLQDHARTAEEIVDTVMSGCSKVAMDGWCDAFQGDCRACKVAWLNSRKEG